MRSSKLPRANQNAPCFNRDRLVAITVAGRVVDAKTRSVPYGIDHDGVPFVLPGSGGVVLSHRVGDPAVGLAGDHVEPGVSIRSDVGRAVNEALLAYSCVGNTATVISGPAAGATGTVTGKHGGVQHVIIDFPGPVLRRVRIGDRIQITAFGQGIELLDFPSVRVLNLAPRLLVRWGLRRSGENLVVPVSHLIPGSLLGSGFGRSTSVLGDIDIQLSDPAALRRLGSLRLGDLVAVTSLDARFGPSARRGALTVGVIVHSDSHLSGHGPGLTPLLVSIDGTLRPVLDPQANIAMLLGLRAPLSPSTRVGSGALDR